MSICVITTTAHVLCLRRDSVVVIEQHVCPWFYESHISLRCLRTMLHPQLVVLERCKLADYAVNCIWDLVDPAGVSVLASGHHKASFLLCIVFLHHPLQCEHEIFSPCTELDTRGICNRRSTGGLMCAHLTQGFSEYLQQLYRWLNIIDSHKPRVSFLNN